MNTFFSNSCVRWACAAAALLLSTPAEADTWFNAVISVFPSSTAVSTANTTLVFGVDSSTPSTIEGVPGGGPVDPLGGAGGGLETVYFRPGTVPLWTDIRAGTDNLQWPLIAQGIGPGGASITWPAGLGTNTTNAAFMMTSSGTRTLTLSNGSGTNVNMLTTTSATLTTGTYSIVFGLNANNEPITQWDAASTLPGVLATINPLTNDRDPDAGDTLTIAGIQYLGQTVNTTSASLATEHGTASISGDRQSISYTPTAGYTGIDSFQYQATDNHGALSPWTDIEVTVASAYGVHTVTPYVLQGANLTVTMTIYHTSISSLSIDENIPKPNGLDDFLYVSGSTKVNGASVAWNPSQSGLVLTFAPPTVPTSGSTISYELTVPATQTAGESTIFNGDIFINGNLTTPGGQITKTTFFVGSPYHSADFLDDNGAPAHDSKIGQDEIQRILYLYNKGGYYKIDPTQPDGFNRSATQPVETSGYHSADFLNDDGASAHDWKIGQDEIQRILYLYNKGGYYKTDVTQPDGYNRSAVKP